MVKLVKKNTKAAAPKAKGQDKKAKAKPVQVVEEEESDSSEEEEEMEVQQTKATKAPSKVTAEESDDDEEEDSDDDDDDDDEDDESEEDEVEAQNGKAQKGPAKEEEEEDSDDDDDDEEDDDDDDSEEESDEEEETPAPQATKRKAETKNEKAVPAKKAKAEEDDDDDDEEDSEEDDDDEESDEEEEESDDDEEEDEEDEEEEEETPQQGKRKAKGAVKEESPAKKAKVEAVEGEQSTLYVGNLTEKVTEEKLQKFFKKKGLTVLDLRYLTKSSGVSLAYVDIPAAEEASALELNGVSVAGAEIKVEKAKSKKTEGKTPAPARFDDGDRDARTLFLRNLSYDSTKESIMEVFTDAVDVRIPVFKDSGRPKGIAFIEFESEAKVEEVKSSMDGCEVDGRYVTMDYVGSKATFSGKSPQGKSPGGAAPPGKTLVVKNLSYSTSSDGLKEAFDGCTGARVIMKPGSDRSRGFGYVDFESVDEAKEAMEKMNQSELDGRTIGVEFGKSGGFREGGGGGQGAQASKTLIVKNLSYDTSEDDLQEAFEGSVSARVITDRETGRSKGFGYIDFESEDAAKEALQNMDKQDLGGRTINLDFALPRSPGGFGGGRGGFRGGRGGGGGFRGGRGGGFGGGRGGFGGGRGGFRGGRGGGDRGRGGRGGGRGGRGGFVKKEGIKAFEGKKKTFDDSD